MYIKIKLLVNDCVIYFNLNISQKHIFPLLVVIRNSAFMGDRRLILLIISSSRVQSFIYDEPFKVYTFIIEFNVRVIMNPPS